MLLFDESQEAWSNDAEASSRTHGKDHTERSGGVIEEEEEEEEATRTARVASFLLSEILLRKLIASTGKIEEEEVLEDKEGDIP